MLLSMTAVMAQTSETVKYNDEGYAEVWNAQQLKSVIQDNNSAKIQLMADIDAAKIGKLCDTFKGTITGKHKVYVESLKRETDVMYAIVGSRNNPAIGNDKTDSWLFDTVDGATFDYIQFKDFRVSHDGGNLGMIAREAVNTNFTNLIFENISIFEDDDNAGVIAGYAQNCSFRFVVTKFTDVTVDGLGVGSLAGKSVGGKYVMCIVSVTSSAYADGSWTNARTGGLVGVSENDNFLGCLSAGLVGGDADELGGIAGLATNTKFTACNKDYAVVSCDTDGSSSDAIYFTDIVDRTREIVNSFTPSQKQRFDKKIVSYAAGTGAGAADFAFTNTAIWGSGSSTHATFPYAISIAECTNLAGLGDAVFQEYYLPMVMQAMTIATYGMSMIVDDVAEVTIDSAVTSPEDDYMGGICGYAENCTFERCTNYATLFNDKYCGCIVGRADACKINNCLNAGMAYVEKAQTPTAGTDAGGIVSVVRDKTKVTNCLSIQDYPIIGFLGYLSEADITSGNNYRATNNNKTNSYACLEMQITTEQLYLGTVANWLNNGSENRNLDLKPWRQNRSGELRDDHPVLDILHKEVLPTDLRHSVIKTEDDLRAFAKEVNDGNQFCNAVLDNDIVMTSTEPWTPIGTKDHRWRGVFDGQGHTISGLKCTVEADSEEGAGLFGTVDVHADIRNVTLDSSCDINNKSTYGAGGIVGTVRNDRRVWGYVLVRGCGNNGKVSGYHHVGGILGRVINDGNDGDGSYVQIVIDKCFNTGDITADSNSALLCGYMQNYGLVTDCWSKGSLRASGENRVFDMGQGEAEYFVGYNQTLNISGSGDIQASVDWGDIDEDKQYQRGVEKILDIEVTPDASLVYSREVTVPEGIECAYATICLPYTLESNDNLKLYTFKEAAEDGNDVNVTFTYKDILPAGTPALFSCEESTEHLEFVNADTDYNGTPIEWSDDEGTWRFIGTYTPLLFEGEKADGIYQFANSKVYNEQTANIAPFNCYLEGPQTKNIIFTIIDDSGDTTVIRFVDNDIVPANRVAGNNKTYSVIGTEVNSSYRGIVINNGKKMLRK